MAEPLKNSLNKKYLSHLAQSLHKVDSTFQTSQFVNLCQANDWAALELKERISRITIILEKNLAGSYPQKIEKLMLVAPLYGGFEALFFPEFVERFGRENRHWNLSMKALKHFTQYSSAEFAIRPFILEDPKKMMAFMLKLSTHKNYHLRRLASEGCRPRLPWAQALPLFKKDPTDILPILENLKNDRELYVRKSVANNINDLSKDNPQLVLKLVEKWMKNPSEECRWIVSHGLRSLIKLGDKKALKILGYPSGENFKVSGFRLRTSKVYLGEDLEFRFKLRNLSSTKLNCMVDFIIFHKKKNGSLQPKVFKLKKICIEGKREIEISKIHKFREISTRAYYTGKHTLQLQINGEKSNKKSFQLQTNEIGSLHD